MLTPPPDLTRRRRGTRALLAAVSACGLAAILATYARGGALDWTPDPDDNPCVDIVAPADPLGAAQWAEWHAALCGDPAPQPTLAELLPPVRRLGGIEVRSDAEAWALLRDAWQPHELAAPPIPLPATGWLLLAAIAAIFATKRKARWKA